MKQPIHLIDDFGTVYSIVKVRKDRLNIYQLNSIYIDKSNYKIKFKLSECNKNYIKQCGIKLKECNRETVLEYIKRTWNQVNPTYPDWNEKIEILYKQLNNPQQ
jgi:asparagine synthetase A